MKNVFLIGLFLSATLNCLAWGAGDSLKAFKLRTKIRPIASADPAAADTDLVFLKETLKGKDIIAVGEATHGSKEFFNLKHRLFRLLCDKSGVKTFGLEESYAAGLIVNDYINGRSSLKAPDVVMKMSFMWRTKEMKDMIEWMRLYNDGQNDSGKIVFFGFDFHGPHHAVKRLYDYFGKTDTVFLSVIKPFLRKFEEVTYPKAKIGEKEFQENKSIIDGIRNTLKNNREKYTNIAGSEKWTEADHLMECLFQYMDTYRSGDVDFFKRDPYMCSNVKWMHAQGRLGGKMMLWAHNEHVAAGGSLPAMGKLVKQEFGDKFYSIGFVFNEGEYTGTRQYKCRALEAGIFSFKPAPSGTFANIVSLTGIKAGFIAMNVSGLDEKMAAWFSGTQRVYEVGYKGFDNMKKLLLKKRKLSEIYDGVFYFGKVTNTDHYLFGPAKGNSVYFNPFPSN